jgi:hypothetical protein
VPDPLQRVTSPPFLGSASGTQVPPGRPYGPLLTPCPRPGTWRIQAVGGWLTRRFDWADWIVIGVAMAVIGAVSPG